jgi:hypothetical protein
MRFSLRLDQIVARGAIRAPRHFLDPSLVTVKFMGNVLGVTRIRRVDGRPPRKVGQTFFGIVPERTPQDLGVTALRFVARQDTAAADSQGSNLAPCRW